MTRHPIVERTAGFAAGCMDGHQLLPPAPAKVVVGVSGGVDSVALLAVLAELGYRPIAVHLNYQLRGDASDGDEAFVREYAAEMNVPLVVQTFDTTAIAQERGDSIQVVARDLRYNAFLEAAADHGAHYVAVGHHADDQAETVLLNLLRGAGPEGLAGMPAQRRLGEGVTLVRPFLPLRRADIIDYARHRGLTWRDDASNESPDYRRGALRSEILPALDAHFGGDVASRIVRSADLMRQYVETSMQPETERRFEASRAQEDATLDIRKLSKQPLVWRQRILLLAAARWLDGVPYTSATATALDALIESQAGRRLDLGRGTVWRERSVIRFVNASEDDFAEAASTEAVIESIPGAAVINRRRVTIELVDAVPRDFRSQHPPDPHAEYIDADRLELPLTIRPWRAGDRMRPLGMPGTKKVSDILTDARVPSSRRRHALVVEDARGIVWLVGHRIDQRVRIVEPGTTRPALLRVLTVS